MKRNMKRNIAVVLLLSIALAAFAGGGNEQEEIPDSLVYLSPSWGTPSQELLDSFEAETGIKVEVSTLDAAGLRSRVVTAAAGNTNPADIIFTGISDFGVFGNSGVLRPVDEIVPQQIFDQVSGREFFQIDDVTYCVPLFQQMVMIDYDRAALEAVGISGSDIETWDDFEQAARALKANGMEYPLAFGIRPWSWYLMALSQGSTLFDEDGNPTFDTPDDPGYQAFEQLIRYFQEGLISPERLTSANPHPSFWSGQAAFHQAWQGSLAFANNPEQSQIAPNAEYLLLPDQHYTWNLPSCLGISTYTEYPQAALRFIEFMTGSDFQNYAYETNGMYPASRATFEELGRNNKIEGFEVLAEQAKYLVPLPYSAPWFAEFESEANDALLRAARGNVSVPRSIEGLAAFQKTLKKEYE